MTYENVSFKHTDINNKNNNNLGKHFESGARVSGSRHHDFRVFHSGPLVLVVHMRADAWDERTHRDQFCQFRIGVGRIILHAPRVSLLH